MKRSLKIILFSLAAYLLLLAALVAAEYGAPGATIRDFWDAVWFSLITMTTVGYGTSHPSRRRAVYWALFSPCAASAS